MVSMIERTQINMIIMHLGAMAVMIEIIKKVKII